MLPKSSYFGFAKASRSRFRADTSSTILASTCHSAGVLEPVDTHGGWTELIKRNQEIFYRCYRSVEATSALPEMFNAQYGLFRILLTMFVLLGVAAAARVTYACISTRSLELSSVGLGGLCVVGRLISYWRVTKRAEDFAKSVYDLFLAQSTAGHPSQSSG